MGDDVVVGPALRGRSDSLSGLFRESTGGVVDEGVDGVVLRRAEVEEGTGLEEEEGDAEAGFKGEEEEILAGEAGAAAAAAGGAAALEGEGLEEAAFNASPLGAEGGVGGGAAEVASEASTFVDKEGLSFVGVLFFERKLAEPPFFAGLPDGVWGEEGAGASTAGAPREAWDAGGGTGGGGGEEETIPPSFFVPELNPFLFPCARGADPPPPPSVPSPGVLGASLGSGTEGAVTTESNEEDKPFGKSFFGPRPP